MRRETIRRCVATLACCGFALLVAWGVARTGRRAWPDTSQSAAQQLADLRTEALTEARPHAQAQDELGAGQSAGALGRDSIGTGGTAARGDTESGGFTLPDGVDYEPNVVLVSLAEGADAADLDALVGRLSGEGSDVSAQELSRGLYELALPADADLEAAINELQLDDAVEAAQPNYLYYAMQGVEADLRELLAESLDPEPNAVPSEPAQVGEDDAAAGQVAAAEDAPAAGEEDAPGTAEQANASEEPLDKPEPADPSWSAAADPEEGQGSQAPGSALAQDQAPTSEPLDAADLLEALSLQVSDPYAGDQWALASIRAFEAWSAVRCEGGVTVAVLDQMPDATHADLSANVVGTYDVVSGTTELGEPVTHGTHVAGVVSAVADNGLGVAGVSYNSGLLLLNVFDGGTTSSAKLKAAYDYVRSWAGPSPVRVINLSVGGALASAGMRADDVLISAIDEAHAEGIVTVAAAGNSPLRQKEHGETVTYTAPYYEYPGDAEHVVSVIGLAQGDSSVERSAGSNYNVAGQQGKNICAPGTSVVGLRPADGYTRLSGTSVAAPHVAGVLALEFAANPALSADEAVGILYSTAQDLGPEGWDLEYGYGEVDAHAAVMAANPLLGATIELSPASFVYSGSACEPAVSVSVEGVALTQGEDFSVSYANNVEAGTASVTVVCEGTHRGFATTNFDIAQRSLDGAQATLTDETCAYTGAEVTPHVALEVDGRSLALGTDYTLAYADNVLPGRATVTASGIGNYTGTISLTFDIVEEQQDEPKTPAPARPQAEPKAPQPSDAPADPLYPMHPQAAHPQLGASSAKTTSLVQTRPNRWEIEKKRLLKLEKKRAVWRRDILCALGLSADAS